MWARHVTVGRCRHRTVNYDVTSGDPCDVIAFPASRRRQLVTWITVVDARRLVPDLTACLGIRAADFSRPLFPADSRHIMFAGRISHLFRLVILTLSQRHTVAGAVRYTCGHSKRGGVSSCGICRRTPLYRRRTNRRVTGHPLDRSWLRRTHPSYFSVFHSVWLRTHEGALCVYSIGSLCP